jgi:LysM repeat protein
MKDLQQAILGILAALLSAALLIGSVSMALVEGTMRRAMAPSQTFPASPTMPPPGFTPSSTPTLLPGELMTRTPISIISLTPTILATSSCSYPPGWSPITVFPGDTLESLAILYGTTTEGLMAGNCLLTNLLVPGTILYVPGVAATEAPISCGPLPGWVFYTVRAGDSLYSLALYYHVTVEELKFANCLSDTLIRVGQNLYVPNMPTPTYFIPPTDAPTRTPTLIPTNAPTDTPMPTPPPTNTPTWPPPPTSTPTSTATDLPSPTETPTDTPLPTITMTDIPMPTITMTRVQTPTITPTPTPTATAIPLWPERFQKFHTHGGR